MAYSDFDHKDQADTNHTLNDLSGQSFSPQFGNAALDIDRQDVSSAEIEKQSKTDSPTNATRVFMWNYVTDGLATFPLAICFWNDANTHVIGGVTGDGANSDANIVLGEADNGSTRNTQDAIGGDLASLNSNLSDGTTTLVGKWVPFRYDLWVDNAGDLNLEVYEDTDGDGSYTKLGSTLTLAGAASFITNTGGAVGLGTEAYVASFDAFDRSISLYTDRFEAFY